MVADADTSLAMHSGDVPVLGTPRVVALAEEATRRSRRRPPAAEHDDRRLPGPADPPRPDAGRRAVSRRKRRSKSIEGRRLTFRVSVSDGRGLVAAGRITRVVVERARFLERAPATAERALGRARVDTDLRVERGDAHAVLTLDRPTKKNALSIALRDEISDALDDARRRRVRQGGRDHRRGRHVLAPASTCPSSRARSKTRRTRGRSGRRATATTTRCCDSPCRRSRRSTGPRSPAASTSRCAATSASPRRPRASRIPSTPSVTSSTRRSPTSSAVPSPASSASRAARSTPTEALALAPRERGRRARRAHGRRASRWSSASQRAPARNLVRTKAKAVARLGFGPETRARSTSDRAAARLRRGCSTAGRRRPGR